MSFTLHPLFPKLRPFMHAEHARPDTRNSRVRIEVSHLPSGLLAEALKALSPCVACGTPMHPIRARRGPNLRRDSPPVHLYFAAACPLDVNVGCSRGTAARDEYERVKYALEERP